MQQGETSTVSTRNPGATPPPTPLINLSGLDDTTTHPTPLLRPRSRRRWIIAVVVLLLIILVGGLILTALNHKPRVAYQYAQPTQGNLTITVSATGPIQSGTYNLVFNGTGGKIDEIDVTVGQKVTKGQVLARLDKTSLQDAVNLAQISVNNARAALNAAINSAGSSSNQSGTSVSADQTAVANAEASQSQTKATGDASVASAQTALNNAQTNLTQVQNTANTQKANALATYKAQAAEATAPSGSSYTDCPPDPPASADSQKYTAACVQAITTYNNTVAQADASVTTAQGQVNTAQAALNQAQQQANANNTTAQTQVDNAKAQLANAQAGAGVTGTTGQSQITNAQSQLNTALAQLAQAQHNLANATLRAPHAGTVTIINGTVGGTPGASATGNTAGTTTAGSAFIQIVDLTALQVQANVNEADIANLQVGETTTFTVDAYGTQQFSGTVSAIPPIGQTSSNVVTYPVTIDVDPNSLKGAHLLPSMTANLTINAVQHNNVILIPVNARNFALLASSGNTSASTAQGGTPQLITTQQANDALNQARQMLSNLETANPNLVSEGPTPAFVIEKSGQQFVARPIVLGLTDGTSYEVLQGLSLSDSFIVGTNG